MDIMLEMNVEVQGCSPHAMLPCYPGIPKWKAAASGCSSYWRVRLAAELAGRDGPCVYLLLVVAPQPGFPSGLVRAPKSQGLTRDLIELWSSKTHLHSPHRYTHTYTHDTLSPKRLCSRFTPISLLSLL